MWSTVCESGVGILDIFTSFSLPKPEDVKICLDAMPGYLHHFCTSCATCMTLGNLGKLPAGHLFHTSVSDLLWMHEAKTLCLASCQSWGFRSITIVDHAIPYPEIFGQFIIKNSYLSFLMQ